MIGQRQSPLPDNTQHSQQTDIHAPSGIRTHNPRKRAAAYLRFRPRGHWEAVNQSLGTVIIRKVNLLFNLLAPEFFLILAHLVYKM